MFSKSDLFRKAHANARDATGRNPNDKSTYREHFAWFLKYAWADVREVAFETRAKIVAPALFAELSDLNEGFRNCQMSDNRFYSSGRADALRSRIARTQAALATVVGQASNSSVSLSH